jgi:alanine racemase
MMPSTSSLLNHPTYAEINLSAFHSNVKALKAHITEKCKLLAVVKTDAYGHGIVPIAKEAVKAGADRLGVTTVNEGILLREAGINLPIQLLSPIGDGAYELAVHHDLIASVSSVEDAEALQAAALEQNKEALVHLKINTGLNRFGIEPEEASDFCESCYDLEGIRWEGIYTHFSHADEGDWKRTATQFHIFQSVVKTLENKGFSFPIHHVGGSTIALEKEKMHLDMVRPGIALFGYPPAKRQDGILPLKRVMTVRTKLIAIRDIREHQLVGYGGIYESPSVERIGIIQVGLGDGYKMALSNNGEVLIKGKRASVIGSISLDQSFIQLTHIPGVSYQDRVTILGEDGKESISARDIATWIQSNTDEVLASFTSRIRRVYTYEDACY